MNRKKHLSIALAAAIALSMTACGSTGTAETEDDVLEDTIVVEVETEEAEENAAEGSVVTSTYAEGTAAAELADLYNSGYITGMIGSNEEGTVVNFYNDDHTDFRQAHCTMTDEQSEAFFNIDWMADDYDQQCFDALAACDDLEITTPEIPDITEYTAYIGQTIGEFEDAGFDFAGYEEDADGSEVLDFYVYTDEGDTYELRVIPDIAEDDDTFYDDEGIKDLTIKDVIFWNFD